MMLLEELLATLCRWFIVTRLSLFSDDVNVLLPVIFFVLAPSLKYLWSWFLG